MADPLTITYAILSIVRIAQDTYALVDRIKDADIKINTIRFRMLNEKERTEIWASRIRFAISEGGRPIPEEKRATVSRIKDQLVAYHRMLQELVAGFEGSGQDVQTSNVSPFRLRFKIATGGYEKLKDLIDAIKAANDTLMTIAAPPPPYESLGHESEPRAAIVGDTPVLGRNEASRELPGAVPSTSEEPVAPKSQRAPHLSIEDVYHIIMKALNTISAEIEEAAHVAARFKLWAVGLFQGNISVDIILDTISAKQRSHGLRSLILEAFGYILILEGELKPRIILTWTY